MPTLAVVDRTRPRGNLFVEMIVIRLPTGMADIQESRRRQGLIVQVFRVELGLAGREVYRRGGRWSPTVCVRTPVAQSRRRYALAEELAALDAAGLQRRLDRRADRRRRNRRMPTYVGGPL